MKYELSIVIPSRNEEWVSRTVEDLIANKTDKTEIIVVLDGAWAEPGIPDHKDVKVIYLPKAVGQRAAQNLGVRLSSAKWVAKVDAHCAFDEGFDKKLLEVAEEDMTLVPVMRNLHVFDWVCENCGMRTYQGPKPTQCRSETCTFDEQKFKKELVWNPKTNPQSSAYRFNKNLQFKYFPELRAKQKRTSLQETMSLQGSFFMCTREKYWELNLCDETWGGWGQQGSEVALKTWLSGGRVLCNMDTWYAHLFRTQAGFSFPYPMSGNDQHKARKTSQQIFLNDKWDKAKYPLKWLLSKFWFALKEVGDSEAKWLETDLYTKGIIYYTHNELDGKLAEKVRKNLKNISDKKNIPITSTSLKPIDFGDNHVVKMKKGLDAYFTQIITALAKSTADIVYFCEHDVLYSMEHFDFTPPEDKFYYNQNFWRLRPDGFAVHWDANQVSGLCGHRKTLLEFYKKRFEEIRQKGFDRRYEPEGRTAETWQSTKPNIDLRFGNTMTKDKWSPKDFRDKSTCINWQEADYKTIPKWKPEQFIDILKL